MRLYSQVDLTGNVNMIEKLVLGWVGLEPGNSRSSARRTNPLRHQDRQFHTLIRLDDKTWLLYALHCVCLNKVALCVFQWRELQGSTGHCERWP